jgi:hypothetical protein
MKHRNNKLLMYGGIALGVVVLWKMFGNKLVMKDNSTTDSNNESEDSESNFADDYSYARGRKSRRGRMPSVAKASGCVQTAQNPYPKWCNGKCISCATNCKDCLAVMKKYNLFAEGDDFLIGEESTYNASGGRDAMCCCDGGFRGWITGGCQNAENHTGCRPCGAKTTLGNFVGDGNEFSSEDVKFHV